MHIGVCQGHGPTSFPPKMSRGVGGDDPVRPTPYGVGPPLLTAFGSSAPP